MGSAHSSPLSASSSSPHKSPFGRPTRSSPKVQELQSAPSYVDIYTGSPLSQSPNLGLLSQGHPDPPRRWQGPRGFGARHVNDHLPFSLWSEDKQDFRSPTSQEMRYILDTFKAQRIDCHGYLIVIETLNPPKPVPLTVAGTAAVFVPPGQEQKYLYGFAPYPNPRLPDPCPHLGWKRMQTPKKSQMVDVISVCLERANVQRVNFLPEAILVELVHGDGRVYPYGSLPGMVAGLPTTYHHESEPLLTSMRDPTRERLLDPGEYLPGPLPQDGTNYLRESPPLGILGPGVMVSTSSGSGVGTADAVQSTTCGIRLRKGPTQCVSVAKHGLLLAGNEVFHPGPDGDKIGDVVDSRPELDIAMVQLIPKYTNQFSNQTYFQAEPPKRLVGKDSLLKGMWFEVDGMSTGLLSFQYVFDSIERPNIPAGHRETPVPQWKHNVVFRIFGASNPELMDGLRGAPFVEVETGNVAGFFHSAGGDWAECAALDDLIAEGWKVV